MKKLIFLFVVIFIALSFNKVIAATCNPCNTDWLNQQTIYFNYGDCVGIEVNWQTQNCNGKCYFKVTSIFWPDDCGTPPSIGTLMYSADSAIISTQWASNNCWPDTVGCEENIESHQDACWKWEYISTHPEGYQLLPCGQTSCCETHWMVCKHVEGHLTWYDWYITYQHVTDSCDDPPEGCSTNCPEIP